MILKVMKACICVDQYITEKVNINWIKTSKCYNIFFKTIF